MSNTTVETRRRVPMTTFHNATAEHLDMAMRSPIVLTNHGRKRLIVAENGYFERLEQIARGKILDALGITAHAAADMPAAMRERILANQPTAEEIANDTWND